jgi:hypothetical protein
MRMCGAQAARAMAAVIRAAVDSILGAADEPPLVASRTASDLTFQQTPYDARTTCNG